MNTNSSVVSPTLAFGRDRNRVSVYRKADTARLDEFIGPMAIAVTWTDVHYTA
jgi:hypothetical protein